MARNGDSSLLDLLWSVYRAGGLDAVGELLARLDLARGVAV